MICKLSKFDLFIFNTQVNEVKGDDVVCLIKNSATLSGSLFTLHVSQICIELPTLTDKDKEVKFLFCDSIRCFLSYTHLSCKFYGKL